MEKIAEFEEKALMQKWLVDFERDAVFFLNVPFVRGAFPFGNGEQTMVCKPFSMLHLEIRFYELVFCYVERIASSREEFFSNAIKCFIVEYFCNAIKHVNKFRDCSYMEKTADLFWKRLWRTPFDRNFAVENPMDFICEEGLGCIVECLKDSPEALFDEDFAHYLIWLLKIMEETCLRNVKYICK